MESHLHLFLSYAEEIRRKAFLKKPALLGGREPSLKELALLSAVSTSAILLSNRFASENYNDQDDWPLPCFKPAFSKTEISEVVGTLSALSNIH